MCGQREWEVKKEGRKEGGEGWKRESGRASLRRSWPGFVCLGMAACDGQARRPRVGSSINVGKGIVKALAGVNLQGGN